MKAVPVLVNRARSDVLGIDSEPVETRPHNNEGRLSTGSLDTYTSHSSFIIRCASYAAQH